MNTKIRYYTQNVYGNNLMYYADSEVEEKMVRLLGQRTITVAKRSTLESIGFTFEQVLPPVPCAKCGGKRDVEAIICSSCKPQ